MSQFEYILTFVAVVFGLAVTQLASHLHKLTTTNAKVVWGVLSPMAAIFIFMKLLIQWWAWYAAQVIAGDIRFEMFIVVMVGTVLLFLTSAIALPEVNPNDTVIDLPLYYQKTSRQFWLLYAASWLVLSGISIWVQVVLQGKVLNLMQPAYLNVPFALLLAFWRNKWVHGICLFIWIIALGLQAFGHNLTMYSR